MVRRGLRHLTCAGDARPRVGHGAGAGLAAWIATMELQDLASRTGTSSAMLLKGGSAAGPDADDEDMYRPQKSNFIVLWFRQYGVLLKNNFTLTVRQASPSSRGRPDRANRPLSEVAARVWEADERGPTWRQFLRYYRSTILQIIAPFFFMLFLYILQKAAESSDVVPNAHPTPYPLGGITPCKVGGCLGQPQATGPDRFGPR